MKRTLILILSSLFLTACATTSQTGRITWPTDDPPEVADAILAWSQGKLVQPRTEPASDQALTVSPQHPKLAVISAESLALQFRLPEAAQSYLAFLKTTKAHPLITPALIRLRHLIRATNAPVPYDDILSLRMTEPYDKALLCLLQDEALGARVLRLKPAMLHPTALALTHIAWLGPFTSNVFSEFDHPFPPDNDAVLADQYAYGSQTFTPYRYIPTYQTVFSAQTNGVYIGETYVETDKDMDVLLTVQSPHLYTVLVDGREVTPAYTQAFQWNPLSVVRLRLSAGHHTLRIRLSKLPKSSDIMPFKAWLIPDNGTAASAPDTSLSAMRETTVSAANAPSQVLGEIRSPHTRMNMDDAANDALYAWGYNVMAIVSHDMEHADQMIKKRQAKMPDDVQNILMYADRMTADHDQSALQRSDGAIMSRESVSEAAPDYALNLIQLASMFLKKNMTQAAFDMIHARRDILPDNADTAMFLSKLYSAILWDADAHDAIVHAYTLEPEWCSIATAYLETMVSRHAVPAYEELSNEIQNCIEVVQFYDEQGYGDLEKLSRIEQHSPNNDQWKFPRLLKQVTSEPDTTFDALLGILDNMSRRMQSSIPSSAFAPFIDAFRSMGREELAHTILERLLAIQPEEVSLHYLKWFIDYEKPLASMRHDGLSIIKSYVAGAPVSDASSIIVFDYASNYYFDNGASMMLTHTITRVLDKDGKTESGEIVIPSDAAVLNLRTIKQNTYEIVEPEIIAHKPSISAPNLGIGDFIEVEYVTWKKPQDAAEPSSVLDPRFYFGMLMTPLVHSEYVVEYPAAWDMHHLVRGNTDDSPLTPACTTKNDRTRCTAVVKDIAPYIAEPASVQLDDVIPNIQYYSNYAWDKLRLRISNTLAQKLAPTPYVRSYLEAMHVPEGSIRERALFIYEHVMTDIKEDENDDYFATSATHTVMRKSGSRMPLLKALFDIAGIPSSIALMRHIASVQDLSVPTEDFMSYFMPALVVQTETGPAYIQTYEDFIPFDFLPPEVQGQELIPLDPSEPISKTRRDTFDDISMTIHIDYQVMADGTANISAQEVLQSFRGLMMRYVLTRSESDQEQINRIIENSLSRSYGRIKLNTFHAEDLKSYTQPLTIRYTFEAGSFATPADNTLRIRSNFLAYQLASRYASLGQRKTPLVLTDTNTSRRLLTFHAPDGYVFEKPETEHVVIDEPFGRFERHYTWEGQILRLEEHIDIRPRIIPAEDYDMFRKFCIQIDNVQNRDFVLVPNTP